jgi:hypothetical protein
MERTLFGSRFAAVAVGARDVATSVASLKAAVKVLVRSAAYSLVCGEMIVLLLSVLPLLVNPSPPELGQR